MRFSEAMDSMRKRASGGSSFGSRFDPGLGLLRQLGFAGLIVKQVDLGMGIIDHDDVVQAVAVEVRHVQLADLAVDGKDLRAGEAEAVGVGGRRPGSSRRSSGRQRKPARSQSFVGTR